MRDQNAQQLLAQIMGWNDPDTVQRYAPKLQLLADYKYDHYQRYGPGKRFIESLALWLQQFDEGDRPAALNFVMDRLVYISDAEFSHLVQMAYPDLIIQERMRLVAEEKDIAPHLVGRVIRDARFNELRLKSLYLGLSDGARTNELRRASDGEIGNEQIWQAYELGGDKAGDMVKALDKTLRRRGLSSDKPRFNLIWLLDDFSGSGNTYIRFDSKENRYKGKIRKIYERLHRGDLIDTSYYEVFLVLYVATQKAVDHIEYWTERFTSENGYKPLQVRVLCTIEPEVAVTHIPDPTLTGILDRPNYYDPKVEDQHTEIGGTKDVRRGFAGCSLPVVLSHNTPNNSLYILWGPESQAFFGLFPRVSRHHAILKLYSWNFKAFYLLNGLSGYALKVTIHADRRSHDPLDLFFALCPLLHDCLALFIEVFAHRRERFHYGFDALAEARAGEILVDHLGLGLLAVLQPGWPLGRLAYALLRRAVFPCRRCLARAWRSLHLSEKAAARIAYA